MKKLLQPIFLIPVVLIVYYTAHSQETRVLQITVAPLSIIDPLTGVFQAGMQQRLNYRLALSIEYGLKFNFLSYYSYNTERKNYHYSKSRIQLKYFIKRPGSNANKDKTPYMALQVFIFPNPIQKKITTYTEITITCIMSFLI